MPLGVVQNRICRGFVAQRESLQTHSRVCVCVCVCLFVCILQWRVRALRRTSWMRLKRSRTFFNPTLQVCHQLPQQRV